MAQAIGSLDLSTLNNLYDETQYFWFESSAQPWGAGAHVTLYPQAEFTTSTHANYLKGQNILMNTDGLSIRNGTLPMMILDNDSLDFNVVDTTNGTYTTTATFTSTGAQIGQSGAAHSVIDTNGQRFYASNGTTQLANIGYGEGASESGTAVAPYYTFGIRLSGSTVGNYSVVGGYYTTASGAYSHAEGYYTTASRTYSHAEGSHTTASQVASHAEGYYTTASGAYSHAEGFYTTASGNSASHAEGYYTTASGAYSHAEGYHTTASGESSHAGGNRTVATFANQTVIGKYNAATVSGSGTDEDPYTYTDVGDYAFIIGNGTSNSTANRSNAFTVDWSGNVTVKGSITASGFPSGLTTQMHSASTGSISATSDSGAKTATVTKAGYYPLAISGWYFAGTNLMYQTLYSCRLSSRSDGSATITYRFYNRSSASYSGTFYFEILWAKI